VRWASIGRSGRWDSVEAQLELLGRGMRSRSKFESSGKGCLEQPPQTPVGRGELSQGRRRRGEPLRTPHSSIDPFAPTAPTATQPADIPAFPPASAMSRERRGFWRESCARRHSHASAMGAARKKGGRSSRRAHPPARRHPPLWRSAQAYGLRPSRSAITPSIRRFGKSRGSHQFRRGFGTGA